MKQANEEAEELFEVMNKIGSSAVPTITSVATGVSVR